MQTRQFQAPRYERVLSVVAALGMLGSLGGMLTEVGNGAAGVWPLAPLLVAFLLMLMWVVQAWRWHVVVDDTGITVHRGFGRGERLSWEQVRGVRVEYPPAVELDDADDLRLGGVSGPPMRGRQVRELAEAVRTAQPDG